MELLSQAVSRFVQERRDQASQPDERREEDKVTFNLCKKLMLAAHRRASTEKHAAAETKVLQAHREELLRILSIMDELEAKVNRVWADQGEGALAQLRLRQQKASAGLQSVDQKIAAPDADVREARDLETLITDRLMTRLQMLPLLPITISPNETILDESTMTAATVEKMLADCTELADLLDEAEVEIDAEPSESGSDDGDQAVVRLTEEEYDQSVIRLTEEEYDEMVYQEEVFEYKRHIARQRHKREALKSKPDLSQDEAAQIEQLDTELRKLSHQATLRGFDCEDGVFLYRYSLDQDASAIFEADMDHEHLKHDINELRTSSRTDGSGGSQSMLNNTKQAAEVVDYGSSSDKALLNGQDDRQDGEAPTTHDDRTDGLAALDAVVTPEDAVDSEDRSLDDYALGVRNRRILAWREEVRRQCEKSAWMVQELESAQSN